MSDRISNLRQKLADDKIAPEEVDELRELERKQVQGERWPRLRMERQPPGGLQPLRRAVYPVSPKRKVPDFAYGELEDYVAVGETLDGFVERISGWIGKKGWQPDDFEFELKLDSQSPWVWIDAKAKLQINGAPPDLAFAVWLETKAIHRCVNGEALDPALSI